MSSRNRTIAAAALLVSISAAALIISLKWPELQQPVIVGATVLGAAVALLAVLNAAGPRAPASRADDPQRADEALKRALRPSLQLRGWIRAHGSGDGAVEVQLSGEAPAVDVDVEVEFLDGQRQTGRAERLSAGATGTSTFNMLVSGQPPARDYDYEGEAFKRATITYSDGRRAGRWRQIWTMRPTERGEGWERPAHWVAEDPELLPD